ncbi:hypothetical protein [Pseudobythopirellula maris]|nr:hypothetical protein [Pseudobythopirellula maris]
MKYSLSTLLGVMSYAALVAFALRSRFGLEPLILVTLAVLARHTAAAVLLRGEERGAALGACLFGGVYLLLAESTGFGKPVYPAFVLWQAWGPSNDQQQFREVVECVIVFGMMLTGAAVGARLARKSGE